MPRAMMTAPPSPWTNRAATSVANPVEAATPTFTPTPDSYPRPGPLGLLFTVLVALIGGVFGIFGAFMGELQTGGLLLLPILAAVGGDTRRFLERTSKIQWGLMVCVFCISHVPALLTLQIPGFEGRNLLLIAFLVIVVQGSDVLQYVFGKLFGRHPLAPSLSPSKTWEGLVGGVAGATLLGAALHVITPFSALAAAALAFVLCLMGVLGGLVMSTIKRDRGVKDWGTLIEGHGGMLDRLDSVIFAAPVFFHLVRFFWAQ